LFQALARVAGADAADGKLGGTGFALEVEARRQTLQADSAVDRKLLQVLARELGDRDWHILLRLGATLCRDDDFVARLGRNARRGYVLCVDRSGQPRANRQRSHINH